MILSCPSCAARFRVRHEMFADGPRKVKCARCSHRWMGEPEGQPDEVPPAPNFADETVSRPAASVIDPVEPDPLSAITEALDVPPLSAEARAMDTPGGRRRTPVWVWAGWFVLLALVTGTALALIFVRGPLVAAWPPLERLYAAGASMTGTAEVPVPDLRVLESTMSEKDGKARMVVTLSIENHSNVQADIPLASVDLINKAGKVFHTELVRIPGKPLEAGEIRPDSLTLEGVPSSLERVRVTATVETREDH
jgi:predicted Zn finger-like uncharacterized protein